MLLARLDGGCDGSVRWTMVAESSSSGCNIMECLGREWSPPEVERLVSNWVVGRPVPDGRVKLTGQEIL